MKKVLSGICSFFLLLAITVPAFAAEGLDTEQQEYIQLINDGVLSEDISFDYWKELKTRSEELESILENSGEFFLVYESGQDSSYTMKKGDVLITNGTSSAGILGHAGIAISGYSILSIAGPGENPATLSLYKWNTDYTSKGWTKAYRHSSAGVASDAAEWASDAYLGSDATYSIGIDLSSTDTTYCSKIVWQAYYYGPATPCANGPTSGVRLPYDLPSTIHDLSLVSTIE